MSGDWFAELCGNTPLVELPRGLLGGRDDVTVLAKLEWVNPTGSVKDRPVLAMREAAQRDGTWWPGRTIVEATSGNTGLSLATAAAAAGSRCVLCITDKVAEEKRAALRALGAELVVCDSTLAGADPKSYTSTAARLAREHDAWHPDQYSNPANPTAHRRTAEELIAQTDGRITHFVAGAGTGGTLCGAAAGFAAAGQSVRIVAADPEGSTLGGAGDAGGWLIEGIGAAEAPPNWDGELVDEVVTVSDAESIHWCRTLARRTGMWAGGSSGTVLAATRRVVDTAEPGSVIVALFADGGRGAVSKIYDDAWVSARGFPLGGPPAWWQVPTVGDVLASAGAGWGFHTGAPDVEYTGTTVHTSTPEQANPRVSAVRGLTVGGRPVGWALVGVHERAMTVAGRAPWLLVCDNGRVVAVVDTATVRAALRGRQTPPLSSAQR